MKKNWNICMAAIGIALCLAGYAGGRQSAAVEGETDEVLAIYCPHPLEFMNSIVSEFENRTEVKTYVQIGGTGELLQMAEEYREPACGIFWRDSLSTTSPRQELFEPYIGRNEDMVWEEFKDLGGSLTRFTDIPGVVMVNTNLVGDTVVEGYEDLLKPRLRGEIAMYNPPTSPSAHEHLINMLYAMGDRDPERGWDYAEQFCRNLDGTLLDGSAQVYQGVTEGQFTMGLTFEEGGAHHVTQGEPIRLVHMKEGVISTPDVVGVVKDSRHMADAEDFVDFVTGRDAQTVIADRLVRCSVGKDTEEPEYLPDKGKIRIIHDDLGLVNSRKKEWLKRFAEIFRRVSDGGQTG